MSGYREPMRSGGQATGSQPARPFAASQWTGIGLIVAAITLNLVYLAQALGWIDSIRGTPIVAFSLMICGASLVNSRREPAVDLAPELAENRRRSLLIVTMSCVVILGAALIIHIATGA